ncbi:uncharacterized protein LOC126965087 isoform X2 [Leptidea sinapis]|uniref:uncharacterized protein LOC126965087 isoform X2 n=1 Tax=Leptidea sinapis TaxID=189913 RepID=UPI0021C29B79|nr:uncharacterized protein LOC126965087 isoform X2 [Leptidea sinapis]
MYHMKNIIPFDDIELPQILYPLKPMSTTTRVESEINIREQNPQSRNLLDLEDRQIQLLKKLDFLYEKIKFISTTCQLSDSNKNVSKGSMVNKTDEIVLEMNSDRLPWFLRYFLKQNKDLSLLWHIHSSTPSTKVQNLKKFFEDLKTITNNKDNDRPNLRLIFKNVSADTELKISALGVPIIGSVNVIRYLCELYPNSLGYDYNDYVVEGILDNCYTLEKMTGKHKQASIKKIFQSNNMLLSGKFTIVDLVLFNEIKQSSALSGDFIPQQWLDKCKKEIM